MPSRPSHRLASLARVLVALIFAIVGAVAPLGESAPAQAADTANFNAGMIISDADFYNWSTMDANAVQAFLNSKVSSCSPGYSCLKDYWMATPSKAANEYCDAYQGSAWESAASIIAKVAQACHINPQAIIVTLQKETSLITSSAPPDWHFDRAMGYYCPDDPNRRGWCNPSYGGVFNQIYNAAKQFQIYRLYPYDFQFRGGTWASIGTQVAGRGCPDKSVYIENQATAGLYNYTPYTPNQAALDAGYGESSDPCATYGNRNFWLYFNDWFGATAKTPYDPFGGADEISGSTGFIRVRGWGADPDQPGNPMYIWVTINGVGRYIIANQARADLAAALPGYGGNHGFDAKIPMDNGTYNVCVAINNVDRGRSTDLGCKNVTVTGQPPFGGLDSVSPGFKTVTVAGWTVDGDGSGQRYVWVDIDGQGKAVAINVPRPDVKAALPWAETNTGFRAALPAPEGTHRVCVTAINSGPGANAPLGCRTVTITGDSPIGSIDAISASNGTAQVRGWTADLNDPTAALYVWVTVDGRGHYIRANGARPDVNAARPGIGSNHGYMDAFTIGSGQHQVCLDVQNVGAGGNTRLGCAVLTG